MMALARGRTALLSTIRPNLCAGGGACTQPHAASFPHIQSGSTGNSKWGHKVAPSRRAYPYDGEPITIPLAPAGHPGLRFVPAACAGAGMEPILGTSAPQTSGRGEGSVVPLRLAGQVAPRRRSHLPLVAPPARGE